MATEAITVGAVAVDVVPSAKNFLSRLIGDIGPEAAKAGKQSGKDFADGFEKESASGTKKASKKIFQGAGSGAGSSGEEAGDEWTSGFARRLRSSLQAATSALPKLDIEVDFDDLGDIEQGLAALRQEVESLSEIDVTPRLDTSKYLREVEQARVAAATMLSRADTTIKVRSDLGDALKNLDNLDDNLNRVNAASGAFGQRFNNTLRGALSNLPRPELDMQFDPTEVRNGIAKIRKDLTALSRQRIGVDISDEEAIAKVTKIKAALESIDRNTVSSRALLDIDDAVKNIGALVGTFESAKAVIEDPIEVPVELRKGKFATELEQITQSIRASLSNLADPGDEGLAGWEAEFDKIRREFEEFASRDFGDMGLDELTRKLEDFRISFAAAAGDEDLTRPTRRNAEGLTEALDGIISKVREVNGTKLDPDFKTAEVNAGRAARNIQDSLRSALADLPDPYVTIEDNSAQAQDRYVSLIDSLRELDGQKIGVDISLADALAQLTELRAVLAALVRRQDIDVNLRVTGEDVLDRIDQQIESLSGRTGDALEFDVDTSTGERKISDFASRLQDAMRVMRAELVDGLDLDLDLTGNGYAELRALLASIEEFTDVEINVDMQASDALTEGGALVAVLKTIASMTDIEIDVKARIVKAIAAFEAVQAEAKKLRDLDYTIEPKVKDEDARRNLGAFASEVERTIGGALSSIGESVDQTKFGGRELELIRQKLAELRTGVLDKTIGGTIAVERLRLIRTQLDNIRKSTADPDILPDVEKLIGGLDKAIPLLDKFGQEERKLSGFGKQLDDLLSKLVGGISAPQLGGLKSQFEDIQIRLRAGFDPTELYAEVRQAGRIAENLAPTINFKSALDVERINTSGAIRGFAKDAENAGGIMDELSKRVSSVGENFSKMSIASKFANVSVYALFAALPILISVGVVALSALAGALLAIGAIAASVFAGIGVFTLAFNGIFAAIQEREQAAKQAGVQAAQDAATALSNSVALRGAAQAITDAEKGVADAKKRVARETTDLAKAEKKQTEARNGLKAATKTAKADLAKLNEEIRKNRIEQQKQIVTIGQAREALNQAYADPTKSGLDIEAAKATYNTAEQGMRDLRVEQNKNFAEKSRYDELGLKANATYKSALDAITSAQESVISQREQLADAVAAQATAEDGVARAKQSQIDLIAQQIAAERVLAETRKTQTAEYDKLTDAGKDFVDFYEKTIKPFFDELVGSAQTSGLLEGIKSFFTELIKNKGSIKDIITNVGKALGTFFAEIGKFLGSAEGKKFLDFLAKNLPKGIETLTKLVEPFGNFLTRIFTALGPQLDKLVPAFAQAIVDLADGLAKFTESDQFASLIDQFITDLPLTGQLLLDIIKALGAVLIILGPYARDIVAVLHSVVEVIELMPESWLRAAGTFLEKLALTLLFITGGGTILLAIALFGKIKDTFDAAKKAGEKLSDFFEKIPDKFKGIALAVAEVFRDHWANKLPGLLESPFKSFRGIINKFIGAINVVGVPFGLNIVPVPELTGSITPPKLNIGAGASGGTFATGGIVPGGVQTSKRDDVVATLRRGEGVLVPEVVKQIGAGTILDWNKRGNLGQRINGYAYGGLVDDIVAFERRSNVPFNVSSGVRDTNDYHGRGMAVDTVSTPANMVSLASWLYRSAPLLLELIHSAGPGYFVKNGKRVGTGFYGAATVADHFDHVHTAMNEFGLRAANTAKTVPEVLSGQIDQGSNSLVSAATSTLSAAVEPLVSRFKSAYGKTEFGAMLGRVPGKLLELATTYLLQKLPASALSGVGGTIGTILARLGLTEDTRNTIDAGQHTLGTHAPPQVAAAYAKSRLGKYGWGAGELGSLAALWTGESGWRWNATNPSSGAYGIPQSWPAGKLAEAGSDWRDNAFTQIDWGMAYIKDRYTSPSNAYQTWLSRAGEPRGKWYDQGGYLPPGITIAHNDTGKPERILTDEQWKAMIRARRDASGELGVTVRVNDGAVPGLISAEVDRQFGSLADAHIYGGA